MSKQFMTNGINSSPTVIYEANAAMTDMGGKAVKLNSSGKIVVCSTEGEAPLGIVTIDNDQSIAEGDGVSVQVKDIGVALMGAAVSAGDELMVSSAGTLKAATSGKYVVAIALANCSSGAFGRVQLVRYKI